MDDNTLLKLAEIITKQNEVLDAMQKNMDGMKTKTAGTWQNANPLHGSGGIFATPGLERDVITAHIRPTSFADALPLLPSVSEDPRFASLTGYTANIGSQPANACDDAPYGHVKSCNLTARFGRIRYDTSTIEMDKVMLKINRGDMTDLILRGRVLGNTELPMSGLNENQILNILTMSEMVGVGVRFERELSRQLWQGVVTIANEFPGLDVQIATGQQDADTGANCYALNSDVKSYGYATLSATIVTYLSQLEWYLKYNATQMGLDPVQWAIVMRPDLWYELTAIWPCAYNTNRCSNATVGNAGVFVDGREMVTERDAMRSGMYLTINGTTYPVFVDTGIFEHNNINNANCKAGEYASTIYMVPLTIEGGFPVTYREYVDYRQASMDISFLNGKEDFFWTDGGSYSWAIEQIKWCYKLAAKTEQRVVLRTPQLAGRIDAVKYSPLQHLRDPNTDSVYFADGGVSLRNHLLVTTPYSAWTGR